MDGTTYSALGQPGVGFFMAIVIGALAGWLAEKLTRSNMGLLANIAMGIIGAVVGNLLLRLLGVGPAWGFLGNLITATVGAIIVITIYRAVAGRRTY
ncbi:MAG: GlsB/YeaQ/YmgE family stress response membrane protein [Microvirga sp.]